jgi:hypothetical protein
MLLQTQILANAPGINAEVVRLVHISESNLLFILLTNSFTMAKGQSTIRCRSLGLFLLILIARTAVVSSRKQKSHDTRPKTFVNVGNDTFVEVPDDTKKGNITVRGGKTSVGKNSNNGRPVVSNKPGKSTYVNIGNDTFVLVNETQSVDAVNQNYAGANNHNSSIHADQTVIVKDSAVHTQAPTSETNASNAPHVNITLAPKSAKMPTKVATQAPTSAKHVAQVDTLVPRSAKNTTKVKATQAPTSALKPLQVPKSAKNASKVVTQAPTSAPKAAHVDTLAPNVTSKAPSQKTNRTTAHARAASPTPTLQNTTMPTQVQGASNQLDATPTNGFKATATTSAPPQGKVAWDPLGVTPTKSYISATITSDTPHGNVAWDPLGSTQTNGHAATAPTSASQGNVAWNQQSATQTLYNASSQQAVANVPSTQSQTHTPSQQVGAWAPTPVKSSTYIPPQEQSFINPHQQQVYGAQNAAATDDNGYFTSSMKGAATFPSGQLSSPPKVLPTTAPSQQLKYLHFGEHGGGWKSDSIVRQTASPSSTNYATVHPKWNPVNSSNEETITSQGQHNITIVTTRPVALQSNSSSVPSPGTLHAAASAPLSINASAVLAPTLMPAKGGQSTSAHGPVISQFMPSPTKNSSVNKLLPTSEVGKQSSFAPQPTGRSQSPTTNTSQFARFKVTSNTEHPTGNVVKMMTTHTISTTKPTNEYGYLSMKRSPTSRSSSPTSISSTGPSLPGSSNASSTATPTLLSSSTPTYSSTNARTLHPTIISGYPSTRPTALETPVPSSTPSVFPTHQAIQSQHQNQIWVYSDGVSVEAIGSTDMSTIKGEFFNTTVRVLQPFLQASIGAILTDVAVDITYYDSDTIVVSAGTTKSTAINRSFFKAEVNYHLSSASVAEIAAFTKKNATDIVESFYNGVGKDALLKQLVAEGVHLDSLTVLHNVDLNNVTGIIGSKGTYSPTQSPTKGVQMSAESPTIKTTAQAGTNTALYAGVVSGGVILLAIAAVLYTSKRTKKEGFFNNAASESIVSSLYNDSYAPPGGKVIPVRSPRGSSTAQTGKTSMSSLGSRSRIKQAALHTRNKSLRSSGSVSTLGSVPTRLNQIPERELYMDQYEEEKTEVDSLSRLEHGPDMVAAVPLTCLDPSAEPEQMVGIYPEFNIYQYSQQRFDPSSVWSVDGQSLGDGSFVSRPRRWQDVTSDATLEGLPDHESHGSTSQGRSMSGSNASMSA